MEEISGPPAAVAGAPAGRGGRVLAASPSCHWRKIDAAPAFRAVNRLMRRDRPPPSCFQRQQSAHFAEDPTVRTVSPCTQRRRDGRSATLRVRPSRPATRRRRFARPARRRHPHRPLDHRVVHARHPRGANAAGRTAVLHLAARPGGIADAVLHLTRLPSCGPEICITNILVLVGSANHPVELDMVGFDSQSSRAASPLDRHARRRKSTPLPRQSASGRIGKLGVTGRSGDVPG